MSEAMLSVDDALARLLGAARPVRETEALDTAGAGGRVLARPVAATVDVPPLDNTSMDGYAVRAAECAGGAARLRVSQRIQAGALGMPLAPGTAARIFTGAPIPPGADAVVMQEQCEAEGDHVVVRHAPAPGEWIRRVGDDIRAGTRILESGARLRPQHLGLAAAAGIASLEVFRHIRAAVFYTGDELVMPGEPLPEGAIYNSNRFTLSGLLASLGCQVVDLGNVPDNLAATREALRRAAREADIVITSGGVSAGEEDHVKPAIEAEGRLDLWKIAVKPGKPLAFGSVGDKPFIGLPGNPVSVLVTFAIFVRPFLLRMQGVERVEPAGFALRADFDWLRPDARREFLRARLNASGGLDLFPNQGSAVLTSAVWADGLIDNAPRRAIRAGESVRFLPWAELLL